MADFRIRPVIPGDGPFLWDMLYEAASVAPEVRALEKPAALALPAVRRWLAGWGRPGDTGAIGVAADARPAGAGWYRLYPPAERGEGIVAWPGVPELAIGVHPDHRGRGLGRALLERLLEQARRDGYRRLALSVDPSNPAIRLYRRAGFRERSADPVHLGTSLLMVAELTGAPGESPG